MSSPVSSYELVVKPQRGLLALNWHELWRFRELFLQLAWRNILVRYKQTVIGLAWAVLQPLLTMIIFAYVFGKVAKLPDGGAPYGLLTMAALLPWQFFSNAMTAGSGSLVNSQSLITKIYFPRLLIPASTVASNAIDSLITLALLLMMMLYYGYAPGPLFLLIPVFFIWTAICALGVSFWFGALNVKYRDINHVVPFIARIGLYVSPVGFLSDMIPADYRLAYFTLNPLAGVIDGFRWCVLGPDFPPYWPGIFEGLATTVLLTLTGTIYFRSTERRFADII